MSDTLWWQLEKVRGFLDAGGPVLWIIIALAAVIGALIAERYWYLLRVFPRRLERCIRDWQHTRCRRQALARRQRSALLSEARIHLRQSLPLLKTLVAICPLLGLLGTVTGMIEVFDVVAVAGTGNARALASGISRATLPTMAGMVVALPGLYFCLQLEQQAGRALEILADRLPLRETMP
ncbi:MAG TPA: MotA/TolQ/ExbB proton channel family protein [Gammaproteobacteria bacterium]|nr:MotA/TolQ/ExbB proton channel family protein [Gammaproteobacteria bacterium]